MAADDRAFVATSLNISIALPSCGMQSCYAKARKCACGVLGTEGCAHIRKHTPSDKTRYELLSAWANQHPKSLRYGSTTSKGICLAKMLAGISYLPALADSHSWRSNASWTRNFEASTRRAFPNQDRWFKPVAVLVSARARVPLSIAFSLSPLHISQFISLPSAHPNILFILKPSRVMHVFLALSNYVYRCRCSCIPLPPSPSSSLHVHLRRYVCRRWAGVDGPGFLVVRPYSGVLGVGRFGLYPGVPRALKRQPAVSRACSAGSPTCPIRAWPDLPGG